MANDIINIVAESGRNIIDDDAEPVFTFQSTNATGTGVRAYASAGGTGVDVDTTTGTGIDVDSTSGTGVDVSTTGVGVQVLRSVGGSATIGPIKVISSVASGVVFELQTGLISTASLTVYKASIPVRLANIDKVVYLHGYVME